MPSAQTPVRPAARVIAAAQALRGSGLTVSSLGNVSVRAGERIWITPSRVFPHELTEEQIVVTSLGGTHLSGPVRSRELPLHLALYRRFPDARAIVHVHSPWAVAWSHLHEDLAHPTEELRSRVPQNRVR